MRAMTRQQLQLSGTSGKGAGLSHVVGRLAPARVHPHVSLSVRAAGAGDADLESAKKRGWQPRRTGVTNALRDKKPPWWKPPAEVLEKVFAAADSFDARQDTRQKRAVSMRLAVPWSGPGQHRMSGPVDVVSIGEWTSPSAIHAHRRTLFECFVNRYIPPAVDVDGAARAGMEWTRPAWWRDADGNPGRRPAKLLSLIHI